MLEVVPSQSVPCYSTLTSSTRMCVLAKRNMAPRGLLGSSHLAACQTGRKTVRLCPNPMLSCVCWLSVSDTTLRTPWLAGKSTRWWIFVKTCSESFLPFTHPCSKANPWIQMLPLLGMLTFGTSSCPSLKPVSLRTVASSLLEVLGHRAPISSASHSSLHLTWTQ